ncbi:MAG: SUMF1/EgtB/PvdO family nonheme iron enzyme [Caldilinea sp.]
MLSNAQNKQLLEALLSAFPSRDELRMMVKLELDVNLEEVAGGDRLRIVTFNLVTWAQRTGRIDDLVSGALAQNSGNPPLQQFVRTWRATVHPATDETLGRSAASTPSGPVSVDVFLSYSRKDSAAMHQVQEVLRDLGLSVWTDEGLEAGTQIWQDAIEEAVIQAQAMVVLLSPNSSRSNWVKNEIGFAQARDKRIFPILVAGDAATAVPISLINTQWVDGRRNLRQAVTQDFLPVLRRHFHLTEPAVPGVAYRKKPRPKMSVPGIALIVAIAVIVGGLGIVIIAPTLFLPAPSAERLTPGPTYTATERPTNEPIAASTNVPTLTSGAIWTNPKDGAVYVYVPAGPFVMGSSDDDSMALDWEKPQQSDLTLDAFWIMRKEVTNAQYAKCVEAGACSEPGGDRWNAPTYAEHPVVNVTWYQAREYAEWAGGRLPTEAEWEKACRGGDGRIWPWGDDPPTAGFANFGMNVGGTAPVGRYSEGASPSGVLDMAGNVWEWTSSLYSPYPYDPNDGREDSHNDGGAHVAWWLVQPRCRVGALRLPAQARPFPQGR